MGNVPFVQKTAPELIWLAVSDDTYDVDKCFPDDHAEICWSDDAPIEVCVPYVRAGLLVMHKCDTPLCVNPDHLAVGTTSDNALDMHRKKRHPGRLKNRNALNPGGSRE